MRRTHFSSQPELEQAIGQVAELLEGWKLTPDEWMLGKGGSLVVAGILRPDEVERDLTIYVLRDRFPWPVPLVARARSAVAPGGSRWATEHHALERQLGSGIDLTPIPDRGSPREWLTEDRWLQTMGGRSINIESPRKYLARRITFIEQELILPVDEARAGYFVDEQRYRSRMTEYGRVRGWAEQHEPALIAEVDRMIGQYTTLIRRLYPELFSGLTVSATNELRGLGAGGAKPVTGEIVIVDAAHESPPDRILVFSHFGPGDNHLAHTARAIVTDGGSIVSHAAILCRELGVPCVVGTRFATKVFKDGDLVEVDATNGVVRKLD